MTLHKGDRHSIGYVKSDADYVFKEFEFALDAPTAFYISTDGYFDQNGGEKGFPLGKKRFEATLLKNREHPFEQQKKILSDQLEIYRGDRRPNDDVAVVGIKID